MEAFSGGGDLQKRKAEAEGGIRVKEDVEGKRWQTARGGKSKARAKRANEEHLKNGGGECASNKGVNLC